MLHILCYDHKLIYFMLILLVYYVTGQHKAVYSRKVDAK